MDNSMYHGESVFINNKWVKLDLGQTKDGTYRVQLGYADGLCIAVEPTIKEAETKLFAYAKKNGFWDRIVTINRDKTDPRNVFKQN